MIQGISLKGRYLSLEVHNEYLLTPECNVADLKNNWAIFTIESRMPLTIRTIVARKNMPATTWRSLQQNCFPNSAKSIANSLPSSRYFGHFHLRPLMLPIPTHFPDLPAPAVHKAPWGPNVCKAHTIISDTFSRAIQLLCQEDGDTLRLRIHSEKILQQIVPLLEALGPEVHNFTWIAECTHTLASVMVALEAAAFAVDGA